MMATTEVVPSVGTGQETASGAAPAPSAETTQLTDEQIIGLDQPETAETAEAQAAPEETAEAVVTEQPEQAALEEPPKEDIPQDGRTIPAELREVFKANPKLRDAWFSERAYREVFPTVREARELREIFPGGVEDAKLLQSGAETLQHLDGLFIAKTPEAHQQLRSELAELDPEANRELAWGYVQDLPRIDPEGYKAAMDEAFSGRVGSWATEQGLPSHAQLIVQALERGETDQATQLARQLVEWSRGIGTARKEEPRGPDPEVERLRAQLAERDARERTRTEESLKADVTNRYITEVKGFLEKAVPTASQRARDKMVGEIVNAINRQLTTSPGFMAQFNQLKATGQMNEAANFVVARAKQLLPQVGRRVLNEWTTEILAANKTTVQKKATAAQSRDVGAGAAPSATAGGKPGKVDYTKASDIDILNS
jgi:hypothetical protein